MTVTIVQLIRTHLSNMRAYELFEDVQTSSTWELLDSSHDKAHWSENLINLVQSAYKKTHFGSFINSLNDVVKSDWLVLDWDENNMQECAIFYRGPRADENWLGNKIQGIGHDGRAISKSNVIGKVQTLLRGQGWWIESSRAMATTLGKAGLPAVKDEELLRAIFSTPTLSVIDNSGLYQRELPDGTPTREIVYGHPRVKRMNTI